MNRQAGIAPRTSPAPTPQAGPDADRPPLDIMIDTETLGVTPGCGVLAIGAVLFDYDDRSSKAHLQPANQFYVVLNGFDIENHGFSTNPVTLRWWQQQPIWRELSTAVRESRTSVREACERLAMFMVPALAADPLTKIWANSPTFDLKILESLFSKTGVAWPLDRLPSGHRRVGDYRTLLDTAFPQREQRPPRPPEVAPMLPHHALGDAIVQADSAQRALDRLAAPRRYDPAVSAPQITAAATAQRPRLG